MFVLAHIAMLECTVDFDFSFQLQIWNETDTIYVRI
jgi:hypothetical protein